MKKKPAIYSAKIKNEPLRIKNGPREEFMKKLVEIPFSSYEVEILSVGRKFVLPNLEGRVFMISWFGFTMSLKMNYGE